MREPKQIRGILDYISLKPGEEFEWEPISESYVPGMGLGASKDAIRWAYKGYMLELKEKLDDLNKRVGGRPAKSNLQKVDNLRAFTIWFVIWKYLPDLELAKYTNRRLIEFMKSSENGLPNSKKYFHVTTNNLEQSLSRGRTNLQIDENWHSDVCEKVYVRFFAKDPTD